METYLALEEEIAIAEHEMPPMPDDVIAELDDFVARRESALPDNVS